MSIEATCASYGGTITGDTSEARKKLQTLVRNAMAVMREQGVYAFYLFLQYRAGQGGDTIWHAVRNLWSDADLGPILPGGTDDRQRIIQLTEDLDSLLLARQVAERTLTYALYGLRAGD
jgi:hypothetical protein